MTKWLFFSIPRTETVDSLRSSRRPSWMFWMSLVLGLLCFPRIGLCQTPISCGQTVANTTTQAGEIDQYSFSGTNGQILSVAMWAGSLGIVADIHTPTGQLQASVNTDTADNLTLTNTGTFIVKVHQSSGAALFSYSLSLQSVTGGGCDSRALFCGQTLTNSTSFYSEMDAYSFSGTNGQLLSMAFWASSDGIVADIYTPAGQLQASINTDTADNLTLTNTGTFTILVHASSYTALFSYSLSLQSVTGGGCDSRALSCGQTLTNSTGFYSEMDAYSFSGTNGQLLSMSFWVSLGGFVADIYTPAGQLQGSIATDKALNLTLTNTGTFTVLVHHSSYLAVASYSLSLQSVTGGGCDSQTISCGQTLTNSTSENSEMDAYSFSGTNGQLLSMAFWVSLGGFVADIYTPAGQLQGSIATDKALNLTLTNTGTFTVLVHHSSYLAVASYSLSLQSVTGGGCDSQTISCGQTLTNSTSENSEMDAYNFSGNAGQILSMSFWVSLGGFVADIYTPAGQLQGSIATDNALNLTLTNTGTFTVLVHHSSYLAVASYSLSLQSVTGGGCDSQTISCGQTLTNSTSFYSEMDGYAFAANAGENVVLTTSGFGAAEFDVYDPTGSNVTRIGPSAVTNLTFALTGYCTILVHANNYASTGTYEFTMTCLNETSVDVSTTTSNASGCGPVPGVFTITRSGPTNGPLTNFYTLSGTASNGVDYVSLPGEVVIARGATSNTITVTPILYSTTNSSRSVVLTLAANPFYNFGSPDSSALTISQTPPPTLTNSPANPGGSPGGPIVVTNVVTSSCVPSSQFVFTNISSPSGVTLNSSTGVLTWTPSTIGTNTIMIAAYDASAPGYVVTSSFNVVVTNATPSVSVTAATPNASDFPLSEGVFVVTRSGSTAGSLTVDYTLSGTASNEVDYGSLSGNLTILGGFSTGDIAITPILYTSASTSRTVVLTLGANASYTLGSPDAATVTIAQIPPPTLTVPTNLTNSVGSTLTVMNVVTSQYIASNEFLFALASAPSGVNLNPVTGVLTWTPTNTGKFTICIGAYYTNAPTFGATNCFTVTVTNNGSTSVNIGIYNTGLAPGFTPLPEGSTDPHYTIVSAPAGTQITPFAPYVVDTNGYPFTGDAAAWLANDATSQWIGVQSNYYNFGQDPVGDYDYRTTFNLTGLNPATAIVAFQFTVDNVLEEVLINGTNANLNLPANPNSETLVRSL